jgi:hypothetical protein
MCDANMYSIIPYIRPDSRKLIVVEFYKWTIHHFPSVKLLGWIGWFLRLNRVQVRMQANAIKHNNCWLLLFACMRPKRASVELCKCCRPRRQPAVQGSPSIQQAAEGGTRAAASLAEPETGAPNPWACPPPISQSLSDPPSSYLKEYLV